MERLNARFALSCRPVSASSATPGRCSDVGPGLRRRPRFAPQEVWRVDSRQPPAQGHLTIPCAHKQPPHVGKGLPKQSSSFVSRKLQPPHKVHGEKSKS